MRLLSAFFKLVRWPNLIFIALTQILYFYCIIPFAYNQNAAVLLKILTPEYFYLLVGASTCIAASGYIINDYFDLNIDRVNKPSKLIVDRYIKRRSAILLHMILSFTGLLISVYVGYRIRNGYIPLFNLISIVGLWFYSTTFKKKLLIGNLLISLLSAWVILVLMAAECQNNRITGSIVLPKLLKVSLLYAGFAFVISLVREIIKDMEDMKGDEKYGCQTMPIAWGIPVSKVFAGVWISVLAGTLTIIELYAWNLGWKFSASYCILTIIIPLIFILWKLNRAQSSEEYHQLSSSIKTIMLAGILSMLFFRFHT